MRRQRTFRPMVGDALEARVTLSHAVPLALARALSVDVVSPQRQLFLNGSVKGAYRVLPVASPIAGTLYELSGEGLVTPLGQVLGRGSVRVDGPTPQGALGGGTFALKGGRGTVDLSLEQLPSPAASLPIPGVYYFRFKISGGTGAYRGATGSGLAVLRLDPPSATSGTFSLTFSSAPSPTPV